MNEEVMKNLSNAIDRVTKVNDMLMKENANLRCSIDELNAECKDLSIQLAQEEETTKELYADTKRVMGMFQFCPKDEEKGLNACYELRRSYIWPHDTDYKFIEDMFSRYIPSVNDDSEWMEATE